MPSKRQTEPNWQYAYGHKVRLAQGTDSRRLLRAFAAGGLTPRAVLEKFCAVQMVDVHLPTTDKRTVILTRYTQPKKDLQVLLEQLKLTLPTQPPPKITADKVAALPV